MPTPAEPEKLAALKPEESAPAEPAKPEIAAAEAPPATAGRARQRDARRHHDEVKLAAIAETPPATMATSTATEPVAEALSLEGNIAATKIATLGGPAVTIEQPASAKTPSAKPDRSAARKRAARAKERRRIAAARRAALLAQQAAAQQQANPFDPQATTRAKR